MEIRELARVIHRNNRKKGFWDKERNVGEMLMLVVSELGEAIEAHRKMKYAYRVEVEELAQLIKKEENTAEFTQLFKEQVKDSFQDELADAVIRLFDMAHGLDIDIQTHIELKMKYNTTREKLHGKIY